MFRFLIRLACILLLSRTACAAIETYDFQNDEQRARYQQLTEELRCPKCQNQNLAGSDSQIASDLRRELHRMLVEGKSNDAIIGFMRERYGDFVMYRPPVQRNTWLLWFGPIALLLVVAFIFVWSRRYGVADAEESVSVNARRDSIISDKPESGRLLSSRVANGVFLFVMIAIAAGSFALYRYLGSAQALQLTELGNAMFAGKIPADQLPKQQAILLEELDSWLAKHPDQDKFLYMRAHVLAERADWLRAAEDYRQLLVRFPDQDNLLAEYAQVLFVKNNRVLTDEAAALLDKALEANPQNATALGLLGMRAFEQANFRKAATLWQRLLQLLPQGSPQFETMQAGIARAKKLGNLPENDAVAEAADVKVAVQVTIVDAVQAQPDETVFVLLRAINGPRMPLAAVKTTVAALAQPVLLDTAVSPMRSQLNVSAIAAFEVVARLSRSGQPTAAVGDWEGQSAALEAGHVPSSLSITIAQEHR
jgi:cytochrome c-type biogenesis protein CcmH